MKKTNMVLSRVFFILKNEKLDKFQLLKEMKWVINQLKTAQFTKSHAILGIANQMLRWRHVGYDDTLGCQLWKN